MDGIETTHPKVDVMSYLPTTATTVNDVRNLVRFLKGKPAGVSALEITDVFRKRLFEPCKLMAYRTWGIVSSETSLIQLSALGERIGESLEHEAKQYRSILWSIESYRRALEWMGDSEGCLITFLQITEFWQQYFPEVFPANDEKTRENCVINFFHLCHSAELGIAAVGRKGQPTRLTVDEAELRNFIDNSDKGDNSADKNFFIEKNTRFHPTPNQNGSTPFGATRMLVSCGEMADFSIAIQEILEITGVQYDLQIRDDCDILLPDHKRKTMLACQAALIIADEKSQVRCDEAYRFKDRLLSEIVASYALFNTQVILIWNGLQTPEVPIKGLQTFCLPAKLDWDKGLELSRLIRGLKDS